MRTAFLSAVLALAVSATAQEKKQEIPNVDAGIGPCRVEFLVNDANTKPVYNAKISTLIRYSTFGVKKMELEVGTNSEGYARMSGLPSLPKYNFVFTISKDDKSTESEYNSLAGCNQKVMIVLK